MNTKPERPECEECNCTDCHEHGCIMDDPGYDQEEYWGKRKKEEAVKYG